MPAVIMTTIRDRITPYSKGASPWPPRYKFLDSGIMVVALIRLDSSLVYASEGLIHA